MTNSTVVSLRGVTRRYETAGPAALDRIDVEVTAGEAVAVMGPSGSGKSTMLNLIAGVDRADGGEVEVAGQTWGRLSEAGLAKFRRTRIGVIFQFFHLLDDLTVRDNVLLPAQLTGGSKQAARARATELLEQLGIADKADALPGATVRRAAPARRGGPGADEQAHAAAGRRADRRGRRAHRRAVVELLRELKPVRADPGGGDPRSGGGAPVRHSG